MPEKKIGVRTKSSRYTSELSQFPVLIIYPLHEMRSDQAARYGTPHNRCYQSGSAVSFF
jgi:hypothetical protein